MTTHRLVYNDSSHTYTLNGRRCKSVTAVAKIVPDSYALENWRKRQVAIGMTLEPRLAERVAVDLDNREAVNQVCEDAMQVAGAHHAANRGTQRHRASELSDLGGKLLTDQQRADAAAWQRTLEKYEIEIDPDFVEGFAVWPAHGVTGRFDRIARYRGRHIILDLKSGENAVKYPQGTCVQLALYARAPLISAAVETVGDRSTVTQWTAPPVDLDLEWGYVVLLSDGMDVGELWRVRLDHGWVGAQLGLDIVQWRKGFRYGDELSERVAPDDSAHGTADVRLADATTRLARASLLNAIKAAKDEAALVALWERHDAAGTWTEEATAAARARKNQLLVTTH